MGSEHPVIGPGRSDAAARAIAALKAAEAEVNEKCHGWADYDQREVRERYAEALAIRNMYPDYGDTFRSH